jgi:hypothetical protein
VSRALMSSLRIHQPGVRIPRVVSISAGLSHDDPISIWEIDMGYRYGRSDIIEISTGTSIWDMGYRDDSIDMVILHIDMGYLVTLKPHRQVRVRRRVERLAGAGGDCSSRPRHCQGAGVRQRRVCRGILALGPGTCCSPRHPTHFEPWFLELYGIL